MSEPMISLRFSPAEVAFLQNFTPLSGRISTMLRSAVRGGKPATVPMTWEELNTLTDHVATQAKAASTQGMRASYAALLKRLETQLRTLGPTEVEAPFHAFLDQKADAILDQMTESGEFSSREEAAKVLRRGLQEAMVRKVSELHGFSGRNARHGTLGQPDESPSPP